MQDPHCSAVTPIGCRSPPYARQVGKHSHIRALYASICARRPALTRPVARAMALAWGTRTTRAARRVRARVFRVAPRRAAFVDSASSLSLARRRLCPPKRGAGARRRWCECCYRRRFRPKMVDIAPGPRATERARQDGRGGSERQLVCREVCVACTRAHTHLQSCTMHGLFGANVRGKGT